MSPCSWSVQKCLAEVVGIARVAPLETGVGTHTHTRPEGRQIFSERQAGKGIGETNETGEVPGRFGRR